MADPSPVYCTICKAIHVDGKHLTLAEVEKRYVLQVYEATGKNKTHTADLLGITLRGLYYKLEKYA